MHVGEQALRTQNDDDLARVREIKTQLARDSLLSSLVLRVLRFRRVKSKERRHLSWQP